MEYAVDIKIRNSGSFPEIARHVFERLHMFMLSVRLLRLLGVLGFCKYLFLNFAVHTVSHLREEV